jgi:hypothetical protein
VVCALTIPCWQHSYPSLSGVFTSWQSARLAASHQTLLDSQHGSGLMFVCSVSLVRLGTFSTLHAVSCKYRRTTSTGTVRPYCHFDVMPSTMHQHTVWLLHIRCRLQLAVVLEMCLRSPRTTHGTNEWCIFQAARNVLVCEHHLTFKIKLCYLIIHSSRVSRGMARPAHYIAFTALFTCMSSCL